MPIIAVAVAAISVSSVGAAGFAAILAGTASIGTMMAGVAAVGATLGAIGAVTGVKELQTAGMVLGGIGGVGALANAVGAFGEGATMGSVFGSSAESVTANAVAPAASLDTASLMNSSGLSSTVIDPVTGAVSSNAGVVDTANQIGGFGTGTMNTGSPDAASALVKTPVANTTVADTGTKIIDTASVPKIDGDLAMAGTTGANSTTSVGDVTGSVTPPADGSGLFSKDGFLRSQGGGMMAMGVVQAAGSFLSGAFDPLKPAQVDAYKAQAAANNASAALTNKQVGNMNEPIPVARRMAVTGKLGGSLINSMPAGAQA